MKKARHQTILDLIAGRAITTQVQLAKLLASRGHKVDQATLSRDLRELGVAKVTDAGGPARYRIIGAPAPAARSIAPLVKSIEKAGNLLVIKTAPGDANRVGVLLDGIDERFLAGTVAGDDTLLVVVRDGHSPAKAARRLKEMAKL